MGLNVFIRSSFHSLNLPATTGIKKVMGLNPLEAAGAADSRGRSIDVEAAPFAGGVPPMRLAGSITGTQVKGRREE